jgi:putative transposase
VQLTTVGKAIWRGARKARNWQRRGPGTPRSTERPEKLKQVDDPEAAGCALEGRYQALVGIRPRPPTTAGGNRLKDQRRP